MTRSARSRAEYLRRAAGGAVPGLPGARCHAVRADRGRRGVPVAAAADPGEGQEAGAMTPAAAPLDLPGRAVAWAGLLPVGADRPAGLRQLSRAVRAHPHRVAVAQTNATGVVSAINFDYRGFDTVGEEFILFVAAIGVATVLRQLRGERERAAGRRGAGRDVPPTSSAVRMVALLLHRAGRAGRLVARLARADQPVRRLPGRGGAGHRVHPDLPVRGVPGVQADQPGRPHRRRGGGGRGRLRRHRAQRGGHGPAVPEELPAARPVPGAVSSSGTIALISFFVGIEVAAAFILIVGELLEQTLLIRHGGISDAGLPVRGGGLDPGRRPVRRRHQPSPGAPDRLPDRGPVVDLRAAPRGRLRDRGVAPYFFDVPDHTPAVDPVVQALALTDVVVEAAVTAMLLSVRDPGLQAVRHAGSAGTRPS